MTKLTVVLILVMTLGTVTAPAAGQTLAERVAAVQEKRAEKEKASKIKLLQALLYQRLTVSFERTPARDVFDYLKIALDINLVARYSDDAVGYGIDPDTPITASADGVPALELLELILEQCSVVDECTWQLRKSYLEVGTKERLSVPATREIRWYPIGELLFEAPDFNDSISLRLEDAFPNYGGYGSGYAGGFINGGGGYGGSIRISPPGSGSGGGATSRVQSLIDLIVELVEPEAWTRNGGDWASIRHREGALIVNAPPYIHRKIGGYPRVPPPKTANADEAPAESEPADEQYPPTP
ncbi:MAG: hypothetical protein ACYS15_02730 [Planctomycetota bacterium]|jgi:hypothetical protein